MNLEPVKRFFGWLPPEEKAKLYFQRGYSWAAKELLIAQRTPKDVAREIEGRRWDDGPIVNHFDVGAQKAVDDFNRATKHETLRNSSPRSNLRTSRGRPSYGSW